MQPSDLTTTSLGRLSLRPWKLFAITVRLPSSSCRVTRRLSCSQASNRPCRSRVNPSARFVGSWNTVTLWPGVYFMHPIRFPRLRQAVEALGALRQDLALRLRRQLGPLGDQLRRAGEESVGVRIIGGPEDLVRADVVRED